MNYIGEHLNPGRLGHFFTLLFLVDSLITTFCYFKATTAPSDLDKKYWRRLARAVFLTETLSVLCIFCVLFYIISHHLFEYKYAWQHSSLSLEPKYLLACFWEGQEGSFLLWSVWHCVLGIVLIRTSKQWEAPVMTIMSAVQFCIATMITGIYIFNWKMGSDPFILCRESGIFDNAPALHENFNVMLPLKGDYLTMIHDGNDLNPLLQNYWMVIHPPVLFMGFASTIVPFAFAIAGLWTRRFTEWIKPVLPWALWSSAVFGIGIMMGAKWAYESLNFGGYWAWDPVENASLVPWMIMIGGFHTLLIYKHTGHSLRATYFFFILSFVFVLYSTFLTRSGILGDTSVHAFTVSGMEFHLFAFLVLFTVPSLLFFFLRYKDIPTIRKEEATSSREFWMFIGSLIFVLSAIVIIAKTSLPVFNKLIPSLKMAPPADPEFAYNSIQVYVAVIIGLLTAVSQYLKYKSTSRQFFLRKIAGPTIVAAVLATLLLAFGHINYNRQGPVFLGSIWLAVVCSVYAIIANLAYIWLGVKGKLGLAGGSIAHFGFGLVLLGILLSSSKKEILSYNTSGIPVDFGKDSKEKSGENLTLIKGVPMHMGNYEVTYTGEHKHPEKALWYYHVHFKDTVDDEEFVLQPDAFVNYKGNEGLTSNPAARHFWDHDIFTYVSSLANPDKNQDTASFRHHTLKLNDTAFYGKGYIILQKLDTRIGNTSVGDIHAGDTASMAVLKVFSVNRSTYKAQPALIKQDGKTLYAPDTVVAEGLVIRLNRMIDDHQADFDIKESNAVLEYITLKAYKFPFINVLWIGILITGLGILMSMIRRIRLNGQREPLPDHRSQAS